MNKRMRELAHEAGLPTYNPKGIPTKLEKFAELIVYDFLSELTNDDSLGEARIATIQRLAAKWGVSQ